MKTVLKYLVGIVLVVTGIWLCNYNWKSYRTKKEIGNLIQRVQHCCFESLAGKEMCIDEFNPEQPTVILYFHPECEHCQYEASEIGNSPAQFEKANMILITADDSTKRIEDFAMKYHLWKVDNLTILLDRKKHFKSHFGTTVVPSIFIYGPDRKLLKMLKGEIQMKAVISAINAF